MQTVKITTSQNIDIDYTVASISDRIAARVIDYFIFICFYSLFIILFTVVVGTGANGTAAVNNIYGQSGIVVLIIIWLCLCVFYDLLTEIFLNGQSIGKRSIKIKVISINGYRPTIGQYLLRWIFRIIDFGVTLGTGAIISVAFSANKQRIGDMVAGTTLIKTSPINKFDDLVFSPPPGDYIPTYNEVTQLSDQDIVLIHDVVKHFNRTGNSNIVYKLALRIKAFLHVVYPSNINEYQFLEIILNDYNYLVTKSAIVSYK